MLPFLCFVHVAFTVASFFSIMYYLYIRWDITRLDILIAFCIASVPIGNIAVLIFNLVCISIHNKLWWNEAIIKKPE